MNDANLLRPRPAILALAVAVSGLVALAAPASAQYYYDRGYAEPEYEQPYYGRRSYGPPRGYYEDQRGYGPPRGGYGNQGVYIDKETAKRNARALKEAQKDAIKHGYTYQPQAQPGFAPQQPRYAQPTYQAPRGAARGYPVPQPGVTAGQNGVPDDPYRNRN